MEGSPNVLAYLALLLALPVSMGLVSIWRAAVAVPIALVAGQMFLPPTMQLDAPVLPPLGKEHFVPLGALLGVALFRRRALVGSKPFRGYDLFVVLRVAGLFGTYLTNQDPIKIGPVVLPGLTLYDFFSQAVREVLFWWPPFFLGRTVIRTSKDLKTLMAILAGAGLIYTFFEFVEMLLSPQLNRWIYGFHPSAFLMSIRGGGYRPMVFMRHGLVLAFFMVIAILAATALGKARGRVFGIPGKIAAIYLFVVLVLCHSLGSLVYAALLAPTVWFAKPRAQARVAAVIAVVAFCYPLSRAVGLVPVDKINDFVLEKFGAERMQSLALRLSEEEWLMNRALERGAFGWGGYTRGFRHNPVTGKNDSITDGIWALEMSGGGAVGFVTLFGMLLYPAWRARRIIGGLSSPDDRAITACLAIMVALYAMELIPNSPVDPYLTFLAGVLAGLDRRGIEPDARDAWVSPPTTTRARGAPAPAV